MKTKVSILAAFCFFIFLSLPSHAQIPRTLSYQGVLTNAAGKPRPNPSYQFTFRLYDVATGGTALWTEEKTLPVTNGLFATALGDQVAFGAAVKFDRQYWLGIQVGNEPELAPRIALTSVGYSMNSLRADTARVAVASLTDSTWKHDGENIFRLNGNVGIGIETPESKFHILNTATSNAMKITIGGGYGVLVENINSGYGGSAKLALIKSINQNPDSYHLYVEGAQQPELVVQGNGNVGIKTDNPLSTLHINPGFGGLKVIRADINALHHFYVDVDTQTEFGMKMGYTGPSMKLSTTPGGTITFQEQGGMVSVPVLEIRGGADLAEPFEMSHSEPLLAGALVVIDSDTPGKMTQATEPYDKRVAGVISGAGGINPGITLKQEGVLDAGQLVALSGKVYALASAVNGTIKPGDLLTTSQIPGHAMKATDVVRSYGAVIGKAMSGLEKGEGLVLVLIQPH